MAIHFTDVLAQGFETQGEGLFLLLGRLHDQNDLQWKSAKVTPDTPMSQKNHNKLLELAF